MIGSHPFTIAPGAIILQGMDQRASSWPGPLRPRHKHDFDEMYTGTPPWDIGRPQPAFLALAGRD